MVTRIPIGSTGEVLIGRGTLPILPEREGRGSAVVITQPGPAEVIATEIASRVDAKSVLTVPDREAAKELSVVGDIYDRLHQLNVGRADTIISVGGGAVTDLGGFVAATWLRGIESVLVPTTLLAAVDASIGGKTGINRHGKNLVGAFWHPRRVVIDLDILDSLPPDLLLAGSAEIIKVGFLSDPSILVEYQRHGLDAPLESVVTKAVAFKVEVVSEDFRETGRRAILNFGHTIGHAVEILAPLPHGLAVAVGMVAAAEISKHRNGFAPATVTDVLAGVGLPMSVSGVSPQAAMELIARDKKRAAEATIMVLLEAIGKPVIEMVTAEEVLAGLAAVGVR